MNTESLDQIITLLDSVTAQLRRIITEQGQPAGLRLDPPPRNHPPRAAMNLTHEQRDKINAFIAEKCGWTFNPPIIMREFSEAEKSAASACWTAPGNSPWHTQQLPDYCASLDACHEALIWLRDNHMDADQWEAFGHKVELIHPTATLSCGKLIDYHDFATLLCTPSDQIALALFQTLGGEL